MLRLQKLPVVTADYLEKAREVSVAAGVGPGAAQDRASWTEPGPHRLRPPAAFRLPGAPAQQACPPRTLGKMNQDHARQVRRSGLCTKWTANISCGDDNNNFFFLKQQELPWRSSGWEPMFPAQEAWVQSLVGERPGPACCKQDLAPPNK